ncbi:glycosyltransferase [Arsenicicoccus piscis]|uniref:Glycosyltransferase n=1 Tax=Arsenicicoccus piscis TaxID=673954 RepID=A0ABQ6HSD1_9MICO|nr:glycosyltransferase [Arsenicicoccus piscis]MCH8626456.1 glycosyltransferase [Arsenicicoccus piscis]GMA21082.1 hypothetical protein GCM10025862_31030 [Arsenicicoccus piscis]
MGAAVTVSAVAVSVVVAHYEQHDLLALVLDALEDQVDLDGRPVELEVVVADDGSAQPPDPGHRPYAVRVVSQADEGFRAASVRNLGLSATTGGTVVFLDADTVPERELVARLAAVVDDGPVGTLAVGRRRHADLEAHTRDEIRDWLAGRGPAPRVLDEPRWLADGYTQTRNLRDADERSYRFVISAVLAAPRSLLDRIGGFDATMSGYGGEDWDLANRAWLAGADLRHVPEAVAWHAGPDVEGRGEPDAVARKNAESLALALRIADPLARPLGPAWPFPRLVALVEAAGVPAPLLLATVASVLAGRDAAVYLQGLEPSDQSNPRDELPEPVRTDPRVHLGAVPDQVRARCHQVLRLVQPAVLAAWPQADDLGAVTVPGLLTLTTTRGQARATERPEATTAAALGVRPLGPDSALEGIWGGWA